MRLHVDSHGSSGSPMLFIHGWGMHGGMWGDVLEILGRQFRVFAVDLPGHGYGRGTGTETIDSIADELADQFRDELTVCGWSLGGQIALRLAMRFPDRVARLVLISSTPCFVQKEGWSCAMSEKTLADFSDALQQDYVATLRRFLSLQLRGSENEREHLSLLRKSLMSRGEPNLAALQSGLRMLRDVDLRDALSDINQPALVISGDRDTLTPLAASRYMAERMPNARLATIAGAAHAPFLSHTEEFVGHISGFMHG